ncbi:nucleotidyltransferase family protein [Niameybacter massiliensis]|uniref:Nucleotidyltransferase family protein n=1 Tax=Holtiella tumoricola TaxID=3018743 RepID=A0AA42DLY3_9FIRM|nr:nucleotidyltransferase family protein [Holtiella tumoricola]
MNTQSYRQLIQLLSIAIKNQEGNTVLAQPINWEQVYKYAQAHQIEGLLYTTIQQLPYREDLPKELLETWKKNTFITGVTQHIHIKQVAQILKMFNEASIPVIILKGLILRQYYPRPEQRTMSDADLLVHAEDLNRIDELLKNAGYNVNHATPIHIVYTGPDSLPIEIHWTLKHNTLFKKVNNIEGGLWANTLETEIEGVKTLCLGLEDQVFHLCTHMATHMVESGFGIRQIADLALIVEAHKNDIQWEVFCNQVEQWHLEKFVSAIFGVYQKLFKMEKIIDIERLGTSSIQIVDALIENLLEAGVYGHENIAFISEQRYLNILFPKKEHLIPLEQYAYLKKSSLLLPIAWIHHLYRAIYHKRYSNEAKLKFACYGIQQVKKRNYLLKQLGLL